MHPCQDSCPTPLAWLAIASFSMLLSQIALEFLIAQHNHTFKLIDLLKIWYSSCPLIRLPQMHENQVL